MGAGLQEGSHPDTAGIAGSPCLLYTSKVIEGVEAVYKLKADGKTVVWPLVSYDFEEAKAVMDIRSGCIFGENLHGLKTVSYTHLFNSK